MQAIFYSFRAIFDNFFYLFAENTYLKLTLFKIEFRKILVNLAAQFDADTLEDVEQIIIRARAA